MRGQVIGTAGGGLAAPQQWAANAEVQRVGRAAEENTGRVLVKLAERGATVLHDLRIPIPGIHANIDHVVVAGRRVWLIDSKAWAPGWYWTVGGKTRRGLTLVPHADKKTIPMAMDATRRYLTERVGGRFSLGVPILAVWPTRTDQRSNYFFYRPAGKPVVVFGENLERVLSRGVPKRPADPQIVSVLANLVNQ